MPFPRRLFSGRPVQAGQVKRKTSKPIAEPSPKAVQKQFTMLPAEVELIEELRLRFQREALARTSKPVDIARSEVVRAGLHSLSKLNPNKLYQAVEAVEELKEGRRKITKPERRNPDSRD
jgi:hypothetical protein